MPGVIDTMFSRFGSRTDAPSNAASVETMQDSSIESESASAPPPLLYNARDHKSGIAFWWTVIVVDYCVAPVILFYPMWYAGVEHAVILGIITGVFGVVTMIEYAVRSFKLMNRNHRFRPLGGKRWHFDFVHLTFSSAFTIVIIELIIGCVPHEPLLRMLAMPIPTMMFYIGFSILLGDVLTIAGANMPVRYSSTAQGDKARPGVYPIIEDVIAVDCDGAIGYREALMSRYEASPMFRKMLLRVSLFWSITMILVAAALTAVIFTVERTVMWGIAYIVPFVWGGIMIPITIFWVQAQLRKEYASWDSSSKRANV